MQEQNCRECSLEIGERDSLNRVYIEDYVDTFLHKFGK